MRADAEAWFEHRTSKAEDWTHDLLLATKGDTTVSVVLPALNEEPTIGRIVHQINHVLGAAAPEHRRLVDELVVIDGGSADRTAAVAAAAGARVEFRADILPALPSIPGKGDAMWRSLAVTRGDLVVFIDADLQSFTPSYITGLIGPLITNPEVALVKAVYERPLVEGSTVVSAGGGRVTELMARPLLNLLWPELAGIIQPLAGEYAARRELLEETGITVGPLHLAANVDSITRDPDGRVRYQYTILDFAARWESGDAIGGSDVSEARWVKFEDTASYKLWSEAYRVIAIARRLLDL